MLKFNSYFRKEELPTVAGYILQYATRDSKEFSDFSSKYDNPYFIAFQDKIDHVRGLMFPETILSELKVATTKLYNRMLGLRPELDKLQVYVKRSNENLNIKAEDFGVKELRREIERRDTEAALDRLRKVIINIESNFSALESQGMKEEMATFFKEMENMIFEDDQKQIAKMDEYRKLIDSNNEVIMELWEMIADAVDTGKAIHKYGDKKKYDNYNYTKLRTLIRNERKKNEE